MPQGQISLAHWRNIKHSLTVAPSLAKAAILWGIHLAAMLASYLTSHERKSLHWEMQLVYSSSSARLREKETRHNVPGHVADYDLELHCFMSDLQRNSLSQTYVTIKNCGFRKNSKKEKRISNPEELLFVGFSLLLVRTVQQRGKL